MEQWNRSEPIEKSRTKFIMMEIKELNEGMGNLTKDEILRIKAAEVTMKYYGSLALSSDKKNCTKPWKDGMNGNSLTERIKSVEKYFRTGRF